MSPGVKTRILFVTDTPGEFGGAERHLFELIRRLDPCLVDCTILYYGLDVYTRHLRDRSDVRIIASTRRKTKTLLSYWNTFTRLRPHIIVFVKGLHGTFHWNAYAAAKVSGARKIFAIEQLIADPVPPEVQGDGIRSFLRGLCGWRARYIWRLRLLSLLCNKTICVSNAVRERLVSDYGYVESRTMTIFNGVDLKHFNSRAYNSAKDMDSLRASTSLGPIIVCVARLSRQKRIDILLEALSLVRVSHPACKCIIVGSGPLEGELHAHSTRLGLAAIVDFVGHVEDVRPYLQKADLFVLSSEREGLPLSLGEAMAHGVPCIATDVGGNREIIAHGNTGLIVEPGSPEQLAQAIDYLLVHPEERSRMAANGKRRVQEHFNIDKTMKRLIDVLVGEPS